MKFYALQIILVAVDNPTTGGGTPDQVILNFGGTLQLIGLALALCMALIIGARLFGQGPKGFGALMGEVAGFAAGLWILLRPMDAIGVLTHAMGGMQALQAIK